MKPWIPWIPLIITLIITLLLNIYPIIMARVDESWVQFGWVYYYAIVPISFVLVVVGLAISLVIYIIRKRRQETFHE